MNSPNKIHDPFDARDTFSCGDQPFGIYRLARLHEIGLGDIPALPYSIRVLLEAVLRSCDGTIVREEDVRNLAAWDAAAPAKTEVPLKTARVVLLDNVTGGWGHVNADNFTASSKQVARTIKPKEVPRADLSKPQGESKAPDRVVEFTIDKKYILYPIKNGAPQVEVSLSR